MTPFDPMDIWMWGSGGGSPPPPVTVIATDGHIDIGGIRLGVQYGAAQIGDM